eukprot:scaffold1116_cov31-Tisochrysis_lutea.AAC.3
MGERSVAPAEARRDASAAASMRARKRTPSGESPPSARAGPTGKARGEEDCVRGGRPAMAGEPMRLLGASAPSSGSIGELSCCGGLSPSLGETL